MDAFMRFRVRMGWDHENGFTCRVGGISVCPSLQASLAGCSTSPAHHRPWPTNTLPRSIGLLIDTFSNRHSVLYACPLSPPRFDREAPLFGPFALASGLARAGDDDDLRSIPARRTDDDESSARLHHPLSSSGTDWSACAEHPRTLAVLPLPCPSCSCALRHKRAFMAG